MPRHIILLTLVAWGHLRPECNLAINLVRRFPDLTISLVADVDFLTNAIDEVKRIAGEGAKDIISRIRVIAAGHCATLLTPPPMSPDFNVNDHRWPTLDNIRAILRVVDSIVQDEPFEDDSGAAWDPVNQKPSLVIADMLMGDIAVPVKEKYKLPTYMFWACNGFTLTRYFAPIASGGQAKAFMEECDAIMADEKKANGRSLARVAREVYCSSRRYASDIVKVKGLKPFYEWEDSPQDRWSPGMYWIIVGIFPFVQKTDGLILPSTLALDVDGIQGVKEWYGGENSRPVFCLGPQLPLSYLDARIRSADEVSSISGNEVAISYVGSRDQVHKEVDPSIAFLDAALAKHGANSVLYITFGSFMFPKPEHVQYLFEVLMELEEPTPFLFAAASPALSMPEELKERIQASGRGLMVPWAPQQSVLLHPATGWALSHCGHGGITESLAQGVPIIAWPISFDQPHNARWMTEVLDTAFELLQVRQGVAQKRAYRCGPDAQDMTGTEDAIKSEMRDVLGRCRGEEGRRKRERAREVKQVMLDARKTGGQIDQHYELLGKLIA
ncbi:glycosyltransferase family 1 protein [Calocera cornea HHB12733]|uniref:Glycosyltransferase family 1 protein n=1 Tax=Calocera cornea HHB12733 TaxID=1353952 RepID=A0A165F5H7_9BASI|nr:glycosyltransferase family 1 protein [Calocera cornea HHB12733]